MDQVRIAFIVKVLSQRGGIEKVVYNLAKSFSEAGDYVEVFCGKVLEKPQAITVTKVGWTRKVPYVFAHAIFKFKMRMVTEVGDYDIIHDHY